MKKSSTSIIVFAAVLLGVLIFVVNQPRQVNESEAVDQAMVSQENSTTAFESDYDGDATISAQEILAEVESESSSEQEQAEDSEYLAELDDEVEEDPYPDEVGIYPTHQTRTKAVNDCKSAAFSKHGNDFPEDFDVFYRECMKHLGFTP